MPITKRSARMADGRELYYFDDADTTLPEQRSPDLRVLDPRPLTATMRQDVLTGEWISIAATRQNRAFLPPAHLDPLAPSTPANPSEVPDNYDVVVFENKSPSFGPELGAVDLDGIGFGRTAPSIGRCEVVCFSPASEGSFGSQTPSRARTVIEAWADRTAELSAMPGIEQVFPFENRGQEIGVTLQHPHGQIYGYPFVTPRTASLITRAGSHRQRTGRDLMGDVLDAERKAGSRVVIDGDNWTAFVPAAARWPVECHLVPHRAVPDMTALDDDERDELAVVYRELLHRLERYFGEPAELPYIAGWHQAPVHTGRDLTRLHLQLFSLRRAPGKLKYLAGSESGMAAWVNDAAPEQIAERLRAAV